MAWTEDQLKAINLEGKNVIVSAGAGSGKTAVLTERVKRKLLDGIHINNLLVLTFTNAAAKEMKDRIRKAILATASLKDEINLIDGAYITTFDSFSLSVVKKYHTKLNITNKIKVSDQLLIDMKTKEILDNIFDEYYLTPTVEFTRLVNDFCLKGDDELKKYILNLYNKISLKYDKKSYLENYFNNLDIDKYVSDYINFIKNRQSILIDLMRNLPNYFENDYIIKVEDCLNKLISAVTYEEIKNSFDYSRTPSVPNGSSDEAKKLKASIFEIANEIKKLCIYSNEDEIKEELLSTKNNTLVIINILLELDKRLEEYKYREEVFNFIDIARMAIRVVMENDDVRDEIRETFQEILVDEYQDTSDLQELFINLISKNNVYMVGDIKQSIYRFRNANPYIFKNKYDLYSNTNEGEKIDLVKNFRSRNEVLEGINLLFDLFMDDTFGGANYRKSHRLVFGNNRYTELDTIDNYDLEIYSYDDNNLNGLSKAEEEAFIIGNDIKQKIANSYKIFDKEENRIRNCRYSDFVILLDRSKDFDLYKKIFEYLQLPLDIVKEETLTKDQDISIIRNLLRLLICIKEDRLDNEFIYSYISICRSFLYKLSDEEIYEIYVSNNYKNTELYNKCLKLIPVMDVTSLSGYLRYVLDEFNYEEKLLSVNNIKNYTTRCEYLYNLAFSMEEVGNTIYDFVGYLNEIFDNEYDLKFNTNSSNSDSIRIMTIHKSKGLEFPICYFAGFYAKFSLSELNDKIVYDNDYGIVLPKVNEYYKDTILKTLIKKNTRREEISERIRLLYVALTRAREKMIIVIPKIDEEDEILDIVPSYQREKYNSFLSIIKSIYSNLLSYVTEVNVIGSRDYQNTINSLPKIEYIDENIIVNEVNIKTDILEEVHYSKEKLHLISEDEKKLMDFGTKVHEVLELIDFNNYNLDLYDIDNSIKSKIDSFINSDFMMDKLNLKMYKEYEFLYNEDNTLSHGIIDLLLEDKDKMIIVDYKLKNIDDLAYDKQLNGYRKFIENKTNKKTECYLYSILDERIRQV
ncbi:MAG: UvrD-helicase domain-containing protein [Bacilli bacterium]|nr:UvrD-helicase domain-containing protein [Bacilli bacterium]